MSFGGGGGFSFGNPANTGNNQQPAKPATGFSFGGAAASNPQQTPATTAPAAGFSFGGGTGQTLGGAAPQQPAGTGNAFSFNSGGSGNLFGGQAAGSTTPASKPAFSFGTPAAAGAAANASTTPASAPPTNLFAGFGKPAAPAGGGGSLFGQPSTSKPAESSATAAPTTFTGFGAPQTSTAGNTAAPSSGFTLGAAPSASSTSGSTSAPAQAAAPATKPAGFSFNTAAPASGSGFSFGAAKPAEGTPASTAATPSSSTAPVAAPFSFGGSAPAASSAATAPSTAAPSSQPAPASLFSGFKVDNKDKPADPAAAAKPATPFAGFGAASTNTTTSAPSTGGLFGAPKSAAPATSTAASAPATSAPAPAPAGGLFAGFGKPAATTENKAPGTTPAAPASAAAPTNAAAASTTPAPVSLPAPSMLRGRNMEEIVNKWTQELESATVEFTRQAAEVAVWDGVLRRGGEEIARLMQSLQAAEERQSSIEQTLDYVEQQQADLTSLLDGYEAQAAELLQGATSNGINAFGSQGVTRSMETGAADAERERAYAMAESLNAQLDELSSNLSSMIVEVNNLSSSTAAARPQAEPDANALGPLRLGSKLHNSGADPVSQIVAILNAHLGSLKWIDESTTALREKVENLRRGQIGGEARASRDRVTSSPSAHRQEGGVNRSNSRNRQSSVAAGGAGSNDTLRSGSVGPGYIRGGSVGRNAGSGWSEATLSTGGGSNLGRSRGYGL